MPLSAPASFCAPNAARSMAAGPSHCPAKWPRPYAPTCARSAGAAPAYNARSATGGCAGPVRATTWTSAVYARCCRPSRARCSRLSSPTSRAARRPSHPSPSCQRTGGRGLAGGKGKAKGKGQCGGGASQPTTYREVRRALEQVLPQLRDVAEMASAAQMAAPGHSHAAQVRVKGGETLSAAFSCVFIGFAFGALCMVRVVHFVRVRDGRRVC